MVPMKLANKVVSLLLAAGLAAISSEANSSAGQANMYGIGGASFESNERVYANPTEEPLDQDSRSMQINLTEDPNPLPPGWSEHFDQSSGQFYYYNSLDGTTTWNRPTTSTLENEDRPRDDTARQSAERAEIQFSNSVAPSEGNIAVSSQESQEVEDSQFGQQQSRDPHAAGILQRQIMEENSVQSHPPNQESQRGDNFPSAGQMATDGGDEQRWTQQDIAPQQVENPESLELSNAAKENSFGDLREQNVPRNPELFEHVPSENMNSAEILEYADRRGSMPHSDRRVAGESQQEQPLGGWGLPNQGTEGLRQRTAPQLSSSAFVRSEKNPENIPHSQFGRTSEVQEPRRQVSSPKYPRDSAEVSSHERPNSAYRIQQERPGRPDQANGAEFGQRQQFGETSASNGQSVTRHQQPSFENGNPALSALPRSQPPNPPHASRSDGPRPPLPNSQYPQQRSRSIPSQSQHRNSQYQRPQGNQRPPQYTNYNYNTQPEAYNQQPSVGDGVTNTLEDGTTAVKDVLGKSWQGLVGFSSRSREAMGQARDQVVTGASVAGQSISAKSTNWWGQAKSAFGSVFEKSDDTAQPQYNMSNQYGGQPQQRYPERQTAQSYGQNPPAYPPPRARGQIPNSLQHERQRPLDRNGVQGQQSQPQNGQIRRAGLQTRYDPPSPQHGQARPPPQPHQNQYQHPPRRPSYGDQQDRPVDRRPQQLTQDRHPDPWSHPGLSGDV